MGINQGGIVMRITKQKENGFYELKKGQETYGEENGIRLVQIVGEYEDIEDEFGVNLITLFKALNDGVYFEKDKKHHIVALDLGSSGNYRLSYEVIDGFFESVYTKDYGKTWALTKEELE